MKPLLWILQSAFGCRHTQMSRVFTIKNRTYQVCFECGRECEYSLASMHRVPPSVAVKRHAPLDKVEQAKPRELSLS
jgi:hypothetical protein